MGHFNLIFQLKNAADRFFSFTLKKVLKIPTLANIPKWVKEMQNWAENDLIFYFQLKNWAEMSVF